MSERKKTRRVEYHRLWPGNGGDSGTWDTDFIDVPADTPNDKLDQAVREAAKMIKWRDEPPLIVGCYNDGGDQLESDHSDAGTDEPDDDESENAACVNCGRTDLPLHINGQCAECGPNEAEALRIRAECHSDDRVYSADFSALAWFEQAEDGDILKLAEEEWGDGYAADEVGMFMADTVTDVEKMFDYLEHYNQAHAENIGWVCTVNKSDALAWLQAHRPDLVSRIESLSADGGQSSGDSDISVT